MKVFFRQNILQIERGRLCGCRECEDCDEYKAHMAERETRARRVKHTVVPLHKSNYIVPANDDEIKGINNKGGFYR
jgi:hypothetical protein